MGVDVVLKRVDQPGSGPRRRRLSQVDLVLDGSDLFAGICGGSGLPMLSRVDPYGDLVLTAREMPQFLSEIDALRSSAAGDREGELLRAVRSLAERCAAEASLELHLVGD